MNPYHHMRRIVLFCIFLVFAEKVWCQQDYFIYIQSETGLPFYSRINDKTFSSSAIGHLVLSGLKDSTYQLQIGFPRNQFPEQVFSIPVNKQDRGFELKNMGDDGWALYDWQSMKFIRAPVKQNKSLNIISDSKRTDPYARLMAGVVNDSIVLYTIITRNEEPAVVSTPIPKTKPEANVQTVSSGSGVDSISKESTATALEIPKTDTAIGIQDPPGNEMVSAKTDTVVEVVAKNEHKPDTVLSPILPQKDISSVKQLSETALLTGKQYVYVDKSLLDQDTITIIIPFDTELIVKKEVSVLKDSSKKDSLNKPETKSLVLINSDCRDFASENDLDKLRVQMLKQDNDDDRIMVARKVFRSKCFTTRQVRALSELFSKDEGRYNFFDAAYPFVSDSGNFKTLVEYLSDPYYLNRFKAMIRS